MSTVNDAIDFISGKSRRIQKNLSKEMEKASKDLDYEKAAIARDRIKALTQIQTSQKINQTNLNEADVISIYKETGKTCIQVFFFRSKQNWGNQAFILNMIQMILLKIFFLLLYLNFMKIKQYQSYYNKL